MALIRCPECGKEISDQAPACIHCGYPLQRTGTPRPPRFSVVLTGVPAAAGEQIAAARCLAKGLNISYDEAAGMMADLPVVVASGLERGAACTLKERLCADALSCKVVEGDQADGPERDFPSSQAQARPLSFGETVGAVIAGVIAGMLLLIFFSQLILSMF